MHRRLAAIACAAVLAAGLGGSAACAQAPGNDRAAIIASYQSIFGIPRTASAADVVRALGPPTEDGGPIRPNVPRYLTWRLGSESSIRFQFSPDGSTLREATIYDAPVPVLRRWLAGRPAPGPLPRFYGQSAAAITRAFERAGLLGAVATPGGPRGANQAISIAPVRDPPLGVQFNCRTTARCEVLSVRWE